MCGVLIEERLQSDWPTIFCRLFDQPSGSQLAPQLGIDRRQPLERRPGWLRRGFQRDDQSFDVPFNGQCWRLFVAPEQIARFRLSGP